MFRLSKMTDYAVVIMAEMAGCEGALLSSVRLAEQTGLSEATVSKVLKSLVKNDLVASVRGVSGGYRLCCAPEQIRLRAVIEAMEGPVALVSCSDGGDGLCQIESHCGVKGRWAPVNDAIKSVLDGVTLSDMVPLHTKQDEQIRQSA